MTGMNIVVNGSRWFRNLVTWLSIIVAIVWTTIFFLPKLFGYYPYVVLSGSMEPVVHVGSLAYVEMYADDEEKELIADEILAYRTTNGEMVLHRLLGMSDMGYVFKGDANETMDAAAISEENIVGKYAVSIPILGYIGAWVSNAAINFGPVKFPAIVLLLAGFIIAANVAYYIIDALCNSSD